MNLMDRYNKAIAKINELEIDGTTLFDQLQEGDQVTIEDVEHMERHYELMDKRYNELGLGIYSK